MKSMIPITLALLGQPNTGKSTLFNAFTGSRQHVGNWPGKTIDQKSGTFICQDYNVCLVDLPGTYRLSADSQEELITRDYMVTSSPDGVVMVVDASQLERSLYLLSEMVGINVPVVVALNMMDVAERNGKTIDCREMESKLGVPVVPVVANRRYGRSGLLDALPRLLTQKKQIRCRDLLDRYRNAWGEDWERVMALLPAEGIATMSREWLAVKLLEQDAPIMARVRRRIGETDWITLETIIASNPDGTIRAADCRFEWIGTIIGREPTVPDEPGRCRLNAFDRWALHPVWGKLIAILIILSGFAVSMLFSTPLIETVDHLSSRTISTTRTGLNLIGSPPWMISLLIEAVIPAVSITVSLVIFVLAVSLVFSLLEDIGYMPRLAFVFDGAMSKLGLYGKCVMPFMMSFGCNMAGIVGARVIDTWQQRILTVVTSWVVPCVAMWGVIGLVGTLFFGHHAIWVMLALAVTALLHIRFTAWFFKRILLKEKGKNSGLIMELPPYHLPNWNTIFTFLWIRTRSVLTKSLIMIMGVSVVLWILSYSGNGRIEESMIYRIGAFIEPVGLWFGLNRQLMMIILVSILGKEAALGAIPILFNIQSGVSSFTGTMAAGVQQLDQTSIATALAASVTQAQALAFMFAFFFNIPCMAAVVTTCTEIHSYRWGAKMAAYYMVISLLLAALVYRIGLLLF
ncbi:MAG: ferrous iron transport protein B [Candidatus Delongbacteria bacterium]|nr:ferrous iron transport protein B [Candidatus Delongbacteria bacterium]